MNFILIGIIVANVLISYHGFNDYNFFRKFEFHVGSIRSGEQIRMLSSGFLHVDIMHLAFNMLTLWFFAPVVVSWLGNFSFVLVYFGSSFRKSPDNVISRNDIIIVQSVRPEL